MIIKYLLILILFVTILNSAPKPKHPTTFEQAKEYSKRLILSEMNNYTIKTLYSQIPLKYTFKVKIPKYPKKPKVDIIFIPLEDRYESSKYEGRSHRIEWEHVVPVSWFRSVNEEIKNAWDFGHSKCVTRSGKLFKGRKCASKVSKLFRKMETDLYNLEPVLGSLNAIKRDYVYGIIDGEERLYGELIDFEVDKNKQVVEPTDNIRGKIARIMLYMFNKYGIIFPDHNKTINLMLEWNNKYPMSPWEKRKREILKTVHGYEF